jgi:hypothetical protein
VRLLVLSLWAWTFGFAIATAITLSFDPEHAWPSFCLTALTGTTALWLHRRDAPKGDVRRVLDYLLRRLVHWLRRHRYTRTAARTRALEIELGMVPPDDTSRERLELLADASIYGGVGAYWTDKANVQQRATGHGRNYFANGDMAIEDALPTGFDRYRHGSVLGAQEHWRRNERPCLDCMRAHLDNTLHSTRTQAAAALMHAGFKPPDVLEAIGPLGNPLAPNDLDAAVERLTARTSE